MCCYWAPINAALPHVQRRQGGGARGLERAALAAAAERADVAEQGYPGFDYTLWVGLWGPAEMPADIVAKINKDVNAALASPDLRERLTKLGTVPRQDDDPASSPSSCARKSRTPTKVLKAAGIKPQ